jgi:hypothetical protein
MTRVLTEEFVRNRVIEWLTKQGYLPTHVRTLSEHGPDIKAKRQRGNYFYIVEVKGEPEKKKPEKFRNLFLISALGEILTRVRRMKYSKYGIALPETFFDLVKRRVPPAAARRMDLEFLFVDSKGGVRRITWADLAEKRTP